MGIISTAVRLITNLKVSVRYAPAKKKKRIVIGLFECLERNSMCNFWEFSLQILDSLYLNYDIHKNLALIISKNFD